MRNNHNTYVQRKPCEMCGYAMKHVTARRRWCKLCIAKRLAVRVNSAAVRAKMAVARFEIDCEQLAVILDAELSAPTRYWEGYYDADSVVYRRARYVHIP